MTDDLSPCARMLQFGYAAGAIDSSEPASYVPNKRMGDGVALFGAFPS